MWFLIVLLISSGTGINTSTIEFTSRDKCEASKIDIDKYLSKTWNGYYLNCVEK